MIPKLSDVIMQQMHRMLQHLTTPQIIYHRDTGKLELSIKWPNPEDEEHFKYLSQEYLQAMREEFEMQIGGK